MAKRAPDYPDPAGNARELPPAAAVGCISSMTGAAVFGVILPCGGLWYAVTRTHDVGGPLFWPAAMIVGSLFGAIVGPVVSTLVLLVLRRFR